MSDIKQVSSAATMPSLPKQRDGGIELLRCILMLFIIGHHIMVHGIGLYDGATMHFDSWIKLGLNSVFVVAVNVFVFISGYFSIKLKTMPLIKLGSQMLFYSISIGLIFIFIGRVKASESSIMSMLFPVSNNVWWFITNYIFLMLISPLLNLIADKLSKKHFSILLLGFLLLEAGIGFYYATATIWGHAGYALFNFITLYLVAAWFKRYHKVKSRWFYALVWLLASAAIFALAIFHIYTQDWSRVFNRAFAYNSPLLYLSAVSLFFFFKSLVINNKLIFFCAPLVLGVYLIHDHPYIRSVLYKTILNLDGVNKTDPALALVLIPAVMLGIFLAGVLIESVRAKLMKPLETKLSSLEFFKSIDTALMEFHKKKG